MRRLHSQGGVSMLRVLARLHVTHAQAPSGSRQIVGNITHALHAASHYYIVQAKLYALSTQHNSLHARCADLVDFCTDS